ncbi:MAG: cytochrome c [Fimbriimonadaceae bacterium]|nr:cytochrome c [Fimbriimonadaceae bacterium]
MAKKVLWNVLALTGAGLVLAGCHTDMWRQPKTMPQTQSDFFTDGQSDRPTVAGTVPRGKLKTENEMGDGRDANGKLRANLPEFLTINGERLSTKTDLAKILERGQERFMVACQHCHGELGDGQGMIAKRGLSLRRTVATYHSDRLREIPIGHFYEVMTKGYGVMFSQAPRVEPDDRWAIAAYIRALQMSQNANENDLNKDDKAKIEESNREINTRQRPSLG